jgi:uncharacterized protein
MITPEEVEAFVHPDYDDKDIMHGFSHMHRVKALAERIAKKHAHDPVVLMLAAYFHGGIYTRESEIKQYLLDKGLPAQTIDKVVRAAWESQKEGNPQTIEGTILHDAHLLEGGKTYIITKSLVTGTLRGQTLEESIAYLEQNVIGKFRCCLPENQALYKEKERYAIDFLDDLKNHL